MGEKSSIHLSAERLSDEIKHMRMYKHFYNDLQRLAASSKVKEEDFKQTLLSAMVECGMENELRNTVFHWIKSNQATPLGLKEPLVHIRKAQIQWEKRIHKSLNSMATEINSPLAQLRKQTDKDTLRQKWQELSVYDIDLSPYRPVYAPKDFLEVLCSIRNPNSRNAEQPKESVEFAYLPFRTKTMSELKSLYQEFSRGEQLLGVDPQMKSASSSLLLSEERTALGQKVLETKHSPVSQEFLKKGAPRCLRARLWAQVVGVEVSEHDYKYYETVKRHVLQYDLLVDKLIMKDIQLTASNDHQYFVFEDILYQVMLCFSRDVEVLTVFHQSCANPVQGALKGKPMSLENTVVYPPCGVIPFHGFTMYVTPLCYLYEDPVHLYYMFKALYVRYWYRLHEVSSQEQGLLCLCILFDRVFQKYEFNLYMHLKQIGVTPVRVVFKWLMRAFSGHLPPEQVLYLWDVILGYDSLEIIPLLAVAILSFRQDTLYLATNLQDVEHMLADLSGIYVMPLLETLLIRVTNDKR